MFEVAVIQVVHPNLSTNYMSEKQVIKWKVKRCPSGPPPLPLIWVLISPGVQGPQGLCSEVYKVSRKKTKNKTKKTHPWCQLTNKISVIQPVISALTDFLVYEAVEQEIMLNMTGRPSNSPALITHAWFFSLPFSSPTFVLKLKNRPSRQAEKQSDLSRGEKQTCFAKAVFWLLFGDFSVSDEINQACTTEPVQRSEKDILQLVWQQQWTRRGFTKWEKISH